MAKVPVAADAGSKRYYKYYEMGIEDLTPEQMAYVANSKGTVEDALEASDRAKLLESGCYPAKTGYYPLRDGGLLVAGNIPMPNVTADMLYWWFAWHGLEPLRYAIWDPEDHFDVKLDEAGRARALDPGIPMNEKTWGATHTVLESVGGPADEIVLMFQDPGVMRYDKSKIGTEDCEFLVCCNALMGSAKIPVIMTECAKKLDGVMTFMARFWGGYHVIDGKARYLLPPRCSYPSRLPWAWKATTSRNSPTLPEYFPLSTPRKRTTGNRLCRALRRLPRVKSTPSAWSSGAKNHSKQTLKIPCYRIVPVTGESCMPTLSVEQARLRITRQFAVTDGAAP